jgi:hypothetical protein
MEYVFGALVVLAVLAFVLLPLVRRAAPRPATPPASSPAVERAEIYRELVELELDRRIGKLDEGDFRAQSDALLERAAALISEDDAAATDAERLVELEIAAMREEIRRGAARPPEEARP